MPPSIPPHDAPTGGVTTRLPLIRKTNGRKYSKDFAKPSSGNSALKPTQPSSSSLSLSSIERRRLAGPNTKLLRGNRQKKLIRKKESNHRPKPSSESGTSASNIQNNSSLETLPSLSTTAAATTATTMQMPSSLDATGLGPYGGMGNVSPYGLYGGPSMMMPPSPYLGMNTMGMPYLSGLNQIVYNVQNIIFSISQATHMIGTNHQALQQAWESLNQMVDHAIATFHEMRALESTEREHETEEEKQKRKRLKALRYAFVFGGGWLAYKLILNLLFRKRKFRLQQNQNHHQQSIPAENNYSTQSYFNNNASMTFPGATAMSSYLPSPGMGYSGYSGNYHYGGNGYY